MKFNIDSLVVTLLTVPVLLLGSTQDNQVDPVTYNIYRANALAEKGQYKQALESLDKAISLDGNSARAYKVRGHVYVALGDLEHALTDLNTVVDMTPDSANAFVDRSIVQFKLGHRMQALRDIDKALELAPESYFAQGVREQILES